MHAARDRTSSEGGGASERAGDSARATRREGKSTAFALALAVAAAPLAVAALVLRPQMARPWPAQFYLSAHLVVEGLVALVAASTFAIQWQAGGMRLGDARARLIGSGFLAVALLEFLHIFAFPGMPGLFWLESSTERGIVYWLAARVFSVATLLGALLVAPGARSWALRRGPLLAFAVGGAALVLAVDSLWPSRPPLFFVEGGGLTALKKAVEAAVVAAALAGAALYARRRQDESLDARHLSVALAMTALSELCFMLYARAYDSFNLLGHAYLLLATYWVFRALFADAVARPYERLAESHAEAERLRRHIEDELDVTIRDLRALQEQQQDFLRAVSHDLRTPLQVVLLQSGRLSHLAPGDVPEGRIARSIAGAGRQMASMIQDLVDAIHLENGAVALSRRRVALGELAEEFLAIARGAALEADRIRLELPPDLPPVAADPSRLQRVLQNLIENALKYSTPGTRVTVSGRRAGEEVVVAVEDRGPGLAPEHLPRLFERFYRGRHGDAPGGLGLGLYISRLIVEAHGGRIWCDSRPGEGSTFSFTVPVELGSRSATPAAPAAVV